MIRSLISLVFLVVCFLQVQAQVFKTINKLPDTGQQSGFTSTFGEDNDFTINPPYFIDNGNGTITDTVTGLMWQKTDGGEMKIENAKIYCDTLSLGGFTDWQLPTALEAYSILNLQQLNPAIDVSYFTNTNAEYWWTSQTQANDTNKIWSANAGGGIGNHPRTEAISAGGTKKFHVRAVRYINAPIALSQRFEKINSTIVDSTTNLQWQSEMGIDSMTWEQALSYADTSTFEGFTDWRLPNIKELFSLADLNIVNTCMNNALFSNVVLSTLWSSTTLINQTGKAWIMDNKFGITTYKDKLLKSKVIIVRTPNTPNSISNIQKHSISIYPNPFHDKIYLGQEYKNQYCILSDMNGCIIYKGKNLENQEFTNLCNGYYTLQLPLLNAAIKLIKD
jgi:hypothetical protein